MCCLHLVSAAATAMVSMVMGKVIATRSVSSQEGWTLWTDNIPLPICLCVCVSWNSRN